LTTTPLINYGAKQTKKGVTVRVKNGRTTLRHAFIATMPNGHKGVFERVGSGHKRVTKKGRSYMSGLPIKELYGPSIPDSPEGGYILFYTGHMPQRAGALDQQTTKNPHGAGFSFRANPPKIRGDCPENVLTAKQDDFERHTKSARSLVLLGCGGRI
jgi:hypothetical protein